MKNKIIASLIAIFSCGIVIATELPMPAESSVYVVSKKEVVIPTGDFFNGTNFVKVERTWVRICINGQSAEYGIKSAEMDNYNNYALVLSNGTSMTIYSNGKTLYYEGNTYSKKQF